MRRGITDQLLLQGKDNNRGNDVLYLGQDFWRGLDCRDNCPDGLGGIHSGDLLVFSTIELERVGDFDIGDFSAFRSNLCS